MAEYVFKLENKEFVTFTDWDDIPENFTFKHVIKYLPDPIPEPHTEEEHRILEMYQQRLRDLMEKERAGYM